MSEVDFGYLEGFAAGDPRVVTEILEVFVAGTPAWISGLDGPGWADVLHTMKGAGRGIGANALGAVCERAEAAGQVMIPEVKAALVAAVAEIEAYLAEA